MGPGRYDLNCKGVQTVERRPEVAVASLRMVLFRASLTNEAVVALRNLQVAVNEAVGRSYSAPLLETWRLFGSESGVRLG